MLGGNFPIPTIFEKGKQIYKYYFQKEVHAQILYNSLYFLKTNSEDPKQGCYGLKTNKIRLHKNSLKIINNHIPYGQNLLSFFFYIIGPYAHLYYYRYTQNVKQIQTSSTHANNQSSK
jgi:hypothetical protein